MAFVVVEMFVTLWHCLSFVNVAAAQRGGFGLTA